MCYHKTSSPLPVSDLGQIIGNLFGVAAHRDCPFHSNLLVCFVTVALIVRSLCLAVNQCAVPRSPDFPPTKCRLCFVLLRLWMLQQFDDKSINFLWKNFALFVMQKPRFQKLYHIVVTVFLNLQKSPWRNIKIESTRFLYAKCIFVLTRV